MVTYWHFRKVGIGTAEHVVRQRYFAKGHSVSPPVHHTGHPRVNGFYRAEWNADGV